MQEQMGAPPPHLGPVRLPPVSLPSEDFLQASQGFNPLRRVSLSDPFLHAYPTTTGMQQDGGSGQPSSTEQYNGGYRRGSSDEASSLLSAPIKTEQSRSASPADAPPFFNGQSAYNGFNNSFGSQPPPANYRFGGPSQPPMAPDATSYFDVSMRRHSLTNGNGGGGSLLSSAPSSSHGHHTPGDDTPPRRPSSESNNSFSGVKRKTSSENTILEESQVYSYPPQHGAQHHMMPQHKRRGSSLTYDKIGNLSLSEHSRRDSGMSNTTGGLSPWEDDRRGSGGSWTSAGSPGYAMSNYSIAASSDPYDQRPQPVYESTGPRGSVALPMGHHHLPPQPQPGGHDADMGYGGRRPSIGISQLVQGPNIGYGQPHHPQSQPQPQQPHQYARGLTQPASMLSSVAHSPPDDQDSDNSGPAVSHHRPPPNSRYANIPAATWGRSNSLPSSVPEHPQVSARHGSTGSLDPNMAYGPGGVLKDSPYSRSPELRVTHKLAERKRRKEMAQLFDDLRDSLPVDRSLKSSKWEILSKAVDYIASLKNHNQELLNDNSMLREHFGIPPPPSGAGPSQHHNSPPNHHNAYDTQHHQQQHHHHPPPPGSSHSSSARSHDGSYPSSVAGQPSQPPPHWQHHPSPHEQRPSTAPTSYPQRQFSGPHPAPLPPSSHQPPGPTASASSQPPPHSAAVSHPSPVPPAPNSNGSGSMHGGSPVDDRRTPREHTGGEE